MDAAATSTTTNRAALLDIVKGGTGVIEVRRYRLKFTPGEAVDQEADYNGPILVPAEERAKFEAALARYYATQGQQYDGNYIEYKYSHRTHQEAVEDARREYAAGPCLVRHENGAYYMHNEDKTGRPTIIDVLITEILQ